MGYLRHKQEHLAGQSPLGPPLGTLPAAPSVVALALSFWAGDEGGAAPDSLTDGFCCVCEGGRQDSLYPGAWYSMQGTVGTQNSHARALWVFRIPIGRFQVLGTACRTLWELRIPMWRFQDSQDLCWPSGVNEELGEPQAPHPCHRGCLCPTHDSGT